VSHPLRFRAEVTGHFVQFFSRYPKIKTVRWHSRFKAEYDALRDAKAAKTECEASGKIPWPDDLRPKESQPEKSLQAADPAAGTALTNTPNHQQKGPATGAKQQNSRHGQSSKLWDTSNVPDL
jgi:hypothetical protein